MPTLNGIGKQQVFPRLEPGANPIKLFTDVI
jgi:hypothetical protein